MTQTALASLMLAHNAGQTLQQEFYSDPEIYKLEMEKIFLKSWLYVGHGSQIPQRGDYFLFRMDSESVIIINNGNGQIRGLINVCRHRGSRLCSEAHGNEKLLVCRYHGWTYELDGALRGAGYAPAAIPTREIFGVQEIKIAVKANPEKRKKPLKNFCIISPTF